MSTFMYRSILWASAASCLAFSTAAMGAPEARSAEAEKLSRALAAFEISSFQNVKSTQCMGVDHASTANGAPVKQFGCDGKPNQNWRLLRSGIVYNFKDVKSDKCMGVDHASTNAGADIAQYNCDAPQGPTNPKSNQSWWLEAVGGTVKNPIVVIHNGKSRGCVGVDHASRDSGVQLKQFPCDNKPNQQWRLIERS